MARTPQKQRLAIGFQSRLLTGESAVVAGCWSIVSLPDAILTSDSCRLSFVIDDLCPAAFQLELEASPGTQLLAQLCLLCHVAIQQKRSTAAGAQDLSTGCSRRKRQLVKVI